MAGRPSGMTFIILVPGVADAGSIAYVSAIPSAFHHISSQTGLADAVKTLNFTSPRPRDAISPIGALIKMSTVQAREQMIEQQVRAWDVLDARVLETLRNVPREAFVSAQHRFLAFADAEIPLPCGQHMLRPSVVGRLLQALALTGGERVLEVGAGSGFVTACLRSSAASVRSLEIFPELAELARRNIASLGLKDVEILTQDAARLESDTRYDAIALTASLPVADERFQRQLAVGGRLFVVVGTPPVMEARLVRRVTEDAWGTESLFETVIDPLVHATSPQGFVF